MFEAHPESRLFYSLPPAGLAFIAAGQTDHAIAGALHTLLLSLEPGSHLHIYFP